MSSRLLAGRYELIEKIGEGGMAIVYKAKCRLLNRYVAIKILRPEFTKDEQFVENFRRESQAAAGLSHPNIVSVYDVGQEGNIHFIVMELVEGKTLSELIEEKGRLDYKEAINITRQVASALSLAHKNQIVHRDIKPQNIDYQYRRRKACGFRYREGCKCVYDHRRKQQSDGLGSLLFAGTGKGCLCGREVGYLFSRYRSL